jgi:hypothetical protein
VDDVAERFGAGTLRRASMLKHDRETLLDFTGPRARVRPSP